MFPGPMMEIVVMVDPFPVSSHFSPYDIADDEHASVVGPAPALSADFHATAGCAEIRVIQRMGPQRVGKSDQDWA
jgi:hypothetical protein